MVSIDEFGPGKLPGRGEKREVYSVGRMFLREEWKAAVLDRMAKDMARGKVFELSTEITIAAKWLIMKLDEKGIPFKVLNLGAGVKKIKTEVRTCPKCHGTGKF